MAVKKPHIHLPHAKTNTNKNTHTTKSERSGSRRSRQRLAHTALRPSPPLSGLHVEVEKQKKRESALQSDFLHSTRNIKTRASTLTAKRERRQVLPTAGIGERKQALVCHLFLQVCEIAAARGEEKEIELRDSHLTHKNQQRTHTLTEKMQRRQLLAAAGCGKRTHSFVCHSHSQP